MIGLVRSSRALTVAVVVALVVLVGSVVVLFSSTGEAVGWFAYSPVQTGDFAFVSGFATLLTPLQTAAAVVAALALAATTGLLGYALGRRVSGPPR